MKTIHTGSRVYYSDDGPQDTGTVIDIVSDDEFPFVVKWDEDGCVDQYTFAQLTLIDED